MVLHCTCTLAAQPHGTDGSGQAHFPDIGHIFGEADDADADTEPEEVPAAEQDDRAVGPGHQAGTNTKQTTNKQTTNK